MNYEFPQNITLQEVYDATREANDRIGTNLFIAADRGDHVIFNYAFSVPTAFPPPTTGDSEQDRRFAILRECRGLTMSKDGHVLARKFHKFFNVGEKPETQVDVIDWTAPHVVMAKEDGSMITPFLSQGRIGWGTKMGLTDVAKKTDSFIEINPAYQAFAKQMLDKNATPMFEWCSRSQRIVLDYPEDRLILTAVRDNVTGEYLSLASMKDLGQEFGIDVVRGFGQVFDPRHFLDQTSTMTGIEGFIIRFDTGHMVKVKTEEYCLIHGTVSDLANEKNILGLIVSNAIDDALPNLVQEDQDYVLEFVARFQAGIDQTIKTIWELTAEGMTATSNQKEFAAWVKTNVPPILVSPVFQAGRGNDPRNAVMMYIEKHLGSGPRIDSVRTLWGGHRWEWANQRVEE